MPSSIEKLHQLAAEYQGPPEEDDQPLELAMRTAVMMVGPLFLDQLPDDPAMLDAGLEEMALKLLSLRSDGARQVRLHADEGPLQLPAGADG